MSCYPDRATTRRIAAALTAVVLLAIPVGAQQTADSTIRRQQQSLDSLRAAVASLQRRLAALESRRAAGDTTVVDELAAIRAAAAAASGARRDTAAAAARAPQTRTALNALNPEITVTGDVRGGAVRGERPIETFTAHEFEISLQSALDPFSAAKVFIGIGDGEVELEEAYAYFTSLPGHLRLDVGQFRQQIGELNRWHTHALPEDNYPLVIRRYAGDEGLLAPGLSAYWPLPFSGRAGAYELTVQATSGGNDVLFAGGSRPAVNAHLLGFWQTSRSTFAQASLSALHGANSDTNLTTRLGVAAARFTWRPPDRAQSRELTLRAEAWALRRKFETPGAEVFDRTRLGAYADASWRLGRRWVASVRGDYVQSPERGPFASEWAVTPTLTFWQSEFVFARAVYEHARDVSDAALGRFSLQLVFSMGPHKHELF